MMCGAVQHTFNATKQLLVIPDSAPIWKCIVMEGDDLITLVEGRKYLIKGIYIIITSTCTLSHFIIYSKT